MKRVTKEIKKRTSAMVNAFPRFVSVVDRGANLIPLSRLQYSENAKFNDVEINRIEFSNAQFKDVKAVEDYLTSNGYEEFSIEPTDTGWFVPGVETDLFEDVSNIEYDDGVMYFIGKLKQESEDAPVANIVESDIQVPADKEVYNESTEETTSEEVVAESEDAPVEEIKNEQEAETQVAQAEDETDSALAVRIAAADVSELIVDACHPDNQQTKIEAGTITASQIAVGSLAVSKIEAPAITTENPAIDTIAVEDVAVEQHSEDEVTRDRDTLISSAKFGSDYSDFKHQLQEAQEQNVIFTFDYLAYLFMDTSYSAVREGDMPQLKKNCLAFYGAMDALLTASKNLSFSEVTEEVEVEATAEEAPAQFSLTKDELEQLIAEKLEQFKQKEVKPVDNEVVLMQNSQRIKTDDLVETAEKEVDPQVAKFNQDKIKDLFGIR